MAYDKTKSVRFAAFSFSLEGHKEAVRKFKRLAQDVRTKIVKKAAQAGAQKIFNAIKPRIPVRTGTYRDALQMKVYARPSRVKVMVRTDPKVIGENRGRKSKKGARAPYDRFQEFGTIRHAPQPAFRPGFDASHEQASKTAGDEFAAGIEQHTK